MNREKTQTTQEVLRKIKAGEIHPKSRFYFVAKNWFFWFAFAVSVVFGSFAFSSIFYQMEETPAWKLISMEQNMGWFGLASLPYIWIILLGIFTILAWLNYKNTRKSYEHCNYIIVLTSIIFAFCGGLVLHSCGFSDQLHAYVKEQVPMYQTYSNLKSDRIKQTLGEYGLEMDDLRSERRAVLREHIKGEKKFHYDYVSQNIEDCEGLDIVCGPREVYFTNAMGCGCVKKINKPARPISETTAETRNLIPVPPQDVGERN